MQITGGESCGVREALKALASRCCRLHNSAATGVSNVLIALTPLSLALAVVSAATRVAGIIGRLNCNFNLKLSN